MFRFRAALSGTFDRERSSRATWKEFAMEDDWTRWLHERAYALWEGDNRPDGRHDEHWRQAEEELKQRAPSAEQPDKSEKKNGG